MGATVTCGKHAAAFQANGRTIYVLFEKTYEKNCHPHTPSWHPVAYGSYETVMKWVFLAASSCEGGMLQNTRGHIRPEKYLADWMSLIRTPIKMPNCIVDIYVGQPGYWRVPIEEDSGDNWSRDNQRSAVLSRLREAGMDDVADRLEAGQHVTNNLYDCVDLLDVVYPNGKYIWRVLGDNMPSINNLGHQELAPEIRAGCQITPVDWRVWKVQNEDHLLIKHDGTHTVEWPYSIVGSYINEVAYQMEMQRTGSAIKAITQFRDGVSSATSLPGEAKITIQRNPTRERWDLDSLDRLAQALGVADTNGHAPPVFATTLAELREADGKDQNALWLLKGVKDASWDISCTTSTTNTFQQLDLLAA